MSLFENLRKEKGQPNLEERLKAMVKQALGSGGGRNNNVRRDYDKYGATAERPTLVGQQEGYNTYKLHLHLPVDLPI